jgi:NADH-quinone oxidoreductase subunit N
MNLPDFFPAYAEIFLMVAGCAILILDLFLKQSQRYVTYSLAQLTLLGAALLTLVSGHLGGGKALFTFGDMYVLDHMAVVLKLLTLIAVSVCFVYSRTYLEQRDLFRGEYFALVIFATLGMLVMISSNSFLVLYIGLELMSLCLYALVALNRDSAHSTEAAMKYFVLGALASGLLLYGMSMMYGATGTLDIAKISETLQAGGGGDRLFLVFGLVFIVAGLAFKLGVVPFHMWVPDVYHGAPNAITLFIASAPKFAAFAMAMRLLVNALLPLALAWQEMLVLLAVLSLLIGNLAAIAQTNLKRLLAYSAIAHMGFMLLALVAGTTQTAGAIGDTASAAAIQAFIKTNAPTILSAYSAGMFYVVVYVLMSLGAFGMILLLSRAGFEADQLEDLRGLNRRRPWYAFIMLVLMFSMAGIPPTVGFYAKLAVLQALVQSGQVWLAVVAVLFSLIGAFYYLRVVKLMYFDEPVDRTEIRAPLDMRVLLSLNAIAILVLGIAPSALLDMCAAAIQALVI